VSDDDLQRWAASRRRAHPTSAEAGALASRWRRRKRRRYAQRTGLGLALAAAVLAVILGTRTPEGPAPAPPAPVAEAPRVLDPGRHVEDGDTVEVAAASAVTVTSPGELVLPRAPCTSWPAPAPPPRRSPSPQARRGSPWWARGSR